MSRLSITPTGREAPFSDDEIIVSKTDLTGKITYANEVFVRVSGYTREKLLGAAHSIIRHPEMPRCVFQYLWDEIQAGREVFAYVVNLAKNGDHYWVYAHVTPSFDASGRIVAYHSNRRTPDRKAIPVVSGLYADLVRAEAGHPTKREAIAASTGALMRALEGQGKSYDEFVWSL